MDNGQKGIATREHRYRGLLGFPEDLDRLFERTFRGFFPYPTRRWRRPWMPEEWLPDTDVFEREGKLVFRLDLPGMKREDIQVKVEADTLVITGRREEKEELKETDYYRCERYTGEFTRAFGLPEEVKPEAIDATYGDGVLEVTVAKPAGAKPTPVQVPVK